MVMSLHQKMSLNVNRLKMCNIFTANIQHFLEGRRFIISLCEVSIVTSRRNRIPQSEVRSILGFACSHRFTRVFLLWYNVAGTLKLFLPTCCERDAWCKESLLILFRHFFASGLLSSAPTSVNTITLSSLPVFVFIMVKFRKISRRHGHSRRWN